MDITYLGHSSFRMRGKDASVVTDPFDPKMVGLKFSGVKADIVTVSHDHKDHNYVDGVKEAEKVVNGPGEYEIKGVSILGYGTFHDSEKGEKRGKNTVYVYEFDNLRIAHLGDLGHKLPEDLLEEIGDIDILLIPVGGVFTIDSALAIETVQAIEPSIVIPMHYQQKGLNQATFSELAPVESFLQDIGLPVEKMGKLSIKQSDFIEETKRVVVLDIS